MRSLNRVMLIGHLAADPDYRQTPTGVKVANFPIATNRIIKDEDGKREIADFHRVVVWNGLADTASQYLVKGTALFVEGKIVNRSYDDKDGKRHFRTEIVADGFNILTWKKSKNGHDEVAIEEISGEAEVEIPDEDLVAA